MNIEKVKLKNEEMKLKRSFNQAGATVVETFAVIAVIAIILLYAAPKVLDMFTSSRESIIVDDISMIFVGAEKKRGVLPTYTGITCANIISDKYITRPWTSCTSANPYQGDYTFAPVSGNPVVTATNLPTEFCSRVANQLAPTSVSAVCASGTLTVTREG